MLDEDLADLYGVETKRLVEQVKRNLERFPEDFMFQLNKEEAAALRSQIATSNTGRGGRRYAPYVFTEQGVAMLSSVLRRGRSPSTSRSCGPSSSYDASLAPTRRSRRGWSRSNEGLTLSAIPACPRWVNFQPAQVGGFSTGLDNLRLYGRAVGAIVKGEGGRDFSVAVLSTRLAARKLKRPSWRSSAASNLGEEVVRMLTTAKQASNP